MIVITGPGRSGTSILARLYQELGFDPTVGGGGWESSIRGGLEDIEVVQLNLQLISELGLRSSVWRLADAGRRLRRLGPPRSPGVAPNPGSRGKSPENRLALLRRVAETVARPRIRVLRWDRAAAVIARHGPEMRRLAQSREVAKDPAFCQTLGIWAAAGADIDFVVVSLRSLESTAEGLLKTGHLPGWARTIAENQVAYRIGLLLAALIDHRLDYAILRFPDFLADADELHKTLRFPTPVSRGRMVEVFEAIREPGLVSSWK